MPGGHGCSPPPGGGRWTRAGAGHGDPSHQPPFSTPAAGQPSGSTRLSTSPQLPGITRPAGPEQTLHRLGRADQPGVLVELREEERHKNAQVLDVMPERGSSTVLGKNRSNLAGSPPGPAWLRPTATAACARPGPPAARPAAQAAAGY